LQAAHEGGKAQLSRSEADALTIDPRDRQHGKARQQKPIGDGPAGGNFRNLPANDEPSRSPNQRDGEEGDQDPRAEK